uniref:Uncharacterized protein n=1 Tax=Rhizophora mucronata TaxID=61149 RepID=A0A2P2MFC6_RHIMU
MSENEWISIPRWLFIYFPLIKKNSWLTSFQEHSRCQKMIHFHENMFLQNKWTPGYNFAKYFFEAYYPEALVVATCLCLHF